MGVPQLLSWLRANCAACFQQPQNPPDNLYIDFNSILYQSVEKVIPTLSTADSNYLETKILLEAVEMLDELIFGVVKPAKCVFVAVDGVSPKGKMEMQRSRRATTGRHHSTREIWDTNAITAGTNFMVRVGQVLRWYAVDRGSKVAIIVSDASVPGEGEQKILSFIRTLRRQPESSQMFHSQVQHCICSNDSDVIVCALTLHEPSTFVLRFHPAVPAEAQEFFSIESFREELRSRLDVAPNALEETLHDVVFLLLLFGNDFVPKISSLEGVGAGQFDTLLDFLGSDFVPRGKHLVNCMTHQIDFAAARYLLSVITDEEAWNTEGGSSTEGKQQLDVGVKRSRGLAIFGGTEAWNFAEEREAAVEAAAGTDEEKACYEFWSGLQWAMRYYSGDESCSWDWFFPYRSVPSIHHLTKYCGDGGTASNRIRERAPPLMPLEQLLLLTPRRSLHVLPAAFQVDYERTVQPLDGGFPIDISSLLNDAQDHPLPFPQIDFSKLHRWYEAALCRVTLDEKERNQTGKMFACIPKGMEEVGDTTVNNNTLGSTSLLREKEEKHVTVPFCGRLDLLSSIGGVDIPDTLPGLDNLSTNQFAKASASDSTAVAQHQPAKEVIIAKGTYGGTLSTCCSSSGQYTCSDSHSSNLFAKKVSWSDESIAFGTFSLPSSTPSNCDWQLLSTTKKQTAQQVDQPKDTGRATMEEKKAALRERLNAKAQQQLSKDVEALFRQTMNSGKK